MTEVSPSLLVITLNINELNLQSKNIEWLKGFKNNNNNKIHLYAAYKRLTSEVRAQ